MPPIHTLFRFNYQALSLLLVGATKNPHKIGRRRKNRQRLLPLWFQNFPENSLCGGLNSLLIWGSIIITTVVLT